MSVLIGIILVSSFVMITAAGTSSRRFFLPWLLVLSVLLAPRMPIGQLTDFQRMDLRFDDFLIMIMCISGVLLLMKKRIRLHYPAYMKYLSFFMMATLLPTILYGLSESGSLLYSLLFWAREVEYISIAFFVPLFFAGSSSGMEKADKKIYALFKVYFVSMILNLLWLVWQLATGTRDQLIKLVDISSYGFSLISESQVSEVASVYAISFIIFVAIFLFYRRNGFLLIMIFGVLIGTISTLSRGFIFFRTRCRLLSIDALLHYFINRSHIKA